MGLTLPSLIILAFTSGITSINFHRTCLHNTNVCFFGVLTKSMSPDYKYESYLGIPYAKPPIGDLRFKRPVKHEFEDECTVYMSLVEKPACAQWTWRYSKAPYGEEDCLYLNIYKKVGEEYHDTLMPVLVEFSDRDFESGDASPGVYSADMMMAFAQLGGLVLVTVNTRLSIFGYLFYKHNNVQIGTGNMGLFDHLMALEWVVQNIPSFGGDPRRITVAGEASVSYLMLNKRAQRIISRVIIRYSSFLNEYNRPWERSGDALMKTTEFGQIRMNEIKRWFKIEEQGNKITQSTEDLLKLVYDSFHTKYDIFNEFRFKPIVDNQWSLPDPFLWAHPVTLYSKPEHTYRRPLCLVVPRLGAFDLFVKLMEGGYSRLNENDNGYTRVTHMVSLGLGTSWKAMVNNHTEIWRYFFAQSTPAEISNIRIDSANIFNLLDLFSTAFMEYSLFKLTHIRPVLPRAYNKVFIILFGHEADQANSARSIYLHGNNFYTPIPNYHETNFWIGPRGDELLWVYGMPNLLGNLPAKFTNHVGNYITSLLNWIETGVYADNSGMSLDCRIGKDHLEYVFAYCDMLRVHMTNGDAQMTVFPLLETKYTRSYLVWDEYFWHKLGMKEYVKRWVPQPNRLGGDSFDSIKSEL